MNPKTPKTCEKCKYARPHHLIFPYCMKCWLTLKCNYCGDPIYQGDSICKLLPLQTKYCNLCWLKGNSTNSWMPPDNYPTPQWAKLFQVVNK